MNNLAIATLELTVDNPNYERLQKAFKEYTNSELFKRRLESGKKLNVLRNGKTMPRIWRVKSRPTNWGDSGWKRERADVELFKKTV